MGLFKSSYHTHHTTQAAPYPQEVTINKPSTGDDLRNLREMREKVLGDLIASELPNDLLTLRVVRNGRDMGFMEDIHVFGALNGHEFRLSLDSSRVLDQMTPQASPDYRSMEFTSALTDTLTEAIRRQTDPLVREAIQGVVMDKVRS